MNVYFGLLKKCFPFECFPAKKILKLKHRFEGIPQQFEHSPNEVFTSYIKYRVSLCQAVSQVVTLLPSSCISDGTVFGMWQVLSNCGIVINVYSFVKFLVTKESSIAMSFPRKHYSLCTFLYVKYQMFCFNCKLMLNMKAEIFG